MTLHSHHVEENAYGGVYYVTCSCGWRSMPCRFATLHHGLAKFRRHAIQAA